jgi:hypothetical protein
MAFICGVAKRNEVLLISSYRLCLPKISSLWLCQYSLDRTCSSNIQPSWLGEVAQGVRLYGAACSRGGLERLRLPCGRMNHPSFRTTTYLSVAILERTESRVVIPNLHCVSSALLQMRKRTSNIRRGPAISTLGSFPGEPPKISHPLVSIKPMVSGIVMLYVLVTQRRYPFTVQLPQICHVTTN